MKKKLQISLSLLIFGFAFYHIYVNELEKANYYLILYAITALIPRFDDITHALNLTWYQIHQYRVKDEEQK